MCPKTVKSSEAFQFLKELIQLVNTAVPNLKREYEYLPGLENLCSNAV